MSSNREKPRLRATKDYSLFVHSAENRPINIEKRKLLRRLMQEHGFLPEHPIIVRKTARGKLEIKDGQHRFAIAQELGLTVWFVISDSEVSTADLNDSIVRWTSWDFATCYANQGKADYAELIEFSKQYSIPLQLSAALLADTISGTNVWKAFKSGTYEIKSRQRALLIATLFAHLIKINSKCKNIRLVEAIYALSLVPGFNATRMMDGASRCRNDLQPFATREGYLNCLEAIYNYGRRGADIPLKIPAENAMRERRLMSGGGKAA